MTQTLQIVQLAYDALGVAAEEIVRAVLLSLRRDVGEVVPIRVQGALLCKTHLSRPCETVGKYLIDYAFFCPIRGFISVFCHGKLPFRQPLPRDGAAARPSAVIGHAPRERALEAVVPQPRNGETELAFVHGGVPFEADEGERGAVFLRAAAHDDRHFVRPLACGQSETECGGLAHDGCSVGRLVCQRIVVHISSHARRRAVPCGRAAHKKRAAAAARPSFN